MFFSRLFSFSLIFQRLWCLQSWFSPTQDEHGSVKVGWTHFPSFEIFLSITYIFSIYLIFKMNWLKVVHHTSMIFQNLWTACDYVPILILLQFPYFFLSLFFLVVCLVVFVNLTIIISISLFLSQKTNRSYCLSFSLNLNFTSLLLRLFFKIFCYIFYLLR